MGSSEGPWRVCHRSLNPWTRRQRIENASREGRLRGHLISALCPQMSKLSRASPAGTAPRVWPSPSPSPPGSTQPICSRQQPTRQRQCSGFCDPGVWRARERERERERGQESLRIPGLYTTGDSSKLPPPPPPRPPSPGFRS